jgi:hypothetical protein
VGWADRSPARLVATDNAIISDAAAIVWNIFPVPPNASQNQRTNTISSSFDSETFVCRSPDKLVSDLRSGNPMRSRPHSQARTLLLFVPLIKAGIYLVKEFSLRQPPFRIELRRSFATMVC